jgi:tetratricopeptide (TPR) repeat protein
MDLKIVDALDRHWMKVAEHSDKADWEHMDRELDSIWHICSKPRFPNAASEKQRCRCEQGKVARRQGRYRDAEVCLEDALSLRDDEDIQQADVMGELSTVYMQRQLFHEAKQLLQTQHDLAQKIFHNAKSEESALPAELQMCRAIGNLGMTNYQLAVISGQPDGALLQKAIEQLWTRVNSAKDLRERLVGRRQYETVRTWEALGLHRLTLCYAADGNLNEALSCGEMSQETTEDSSDPTVRALSRFFYGYALWRDGQRDEAVAQWEFAKAGDSCTSAMALCKEPSEEQREYLEILVKERVRMDGYDEQNHSALDYAVYCEDEVTEQVVLQGLANTHSESEVLKLREEAHLRKQYRKIFQETFRKELMKERSDCIATMRSLYAKLLDTDEMKRQLLDRFKYVRYTDFDGLGRMPKSDDGVTLTFSDQSPYQNGSTLTQYVIFISYRWLGKDSQPPSHNPDDADHTQYKRVRVAVTEFLDNHPNASPGNIALWLVSLLPIV